MGRNAAQVAISALLTGRDRRPCRALWCASGPTCACDHRSSERPRFLTAVREYRRFVAVQLMSWAQGPTTLLSAEHAAVAAVAKALYEHLLEPGTQAAIDAANRPGVSSAHVQARLLAQATELGFHSERQGLFATYTTPGLRPDYYRALPEHRTGIILEVERGKTTINNMDLLDLWKCHICAEAHHLFLLVPQVLQQNADNPRVTRPYDYVRKRLPSFFTAGNYTNVRSCWLFGY